MNGTIAGTTDIAGNTAQLQRATYRPVSVGVTVKFQSRWSVSRGGLTVAAFLLISGVVCDSVIDGFQRFSLGVGLPDPVEAARMLLGSLVVSALIGLLASLTGRLWASVGLVLTFSSVLGFFNGLKLDMRFEPLYPGDVTMTGETASIMKMVGWSPLVGGLLLAGATSAIGVLITRITRSTGVALEMKALWCGRARYWARGLSLVLSLAVLACAAGFNSPGNPLRRAYLATGSTWSGRSQAEVYAHEGFVGATLQNLHPVAMRRPRGYSEETMQRLQDRYTAIAARRNRGRDPDPLRRMNVVVVLSESFSDPTRLHGLTLQRDPVPFVHRLARSTLSGNMLSPGYGGGTANVEFEALTGFSMSQFLPGLTYPYSMLVAQRTHFPSAVDHFLRTGHRAIAIHPHISSFYSRDEVYPALGFNRFISQDDMHFRARDGKNGFISDEAAFDEVERTLARTPRPAFVHLVTMQNHGPYEGRYAQPQETGLTGRPGAEAGNYLVGLQHSDAALRRFIQRLQQLGEPTAVVFFGDHQPGIWPSTVVAASGRQRAFETPYFIWTNTPRTLGKSPRVTSPIYFMPALFDLVNAPTPPFLALLRTLQAHVAALDSGMTFDEDGDLISDGELAPSSRRLLHDFRLVQFDVTEGQRFLPESFFADSP